MKRLLVTLLLTLMVFTAGCSPALDQDPAKSTQELVDIRLILPFRPDIQFAPFYVGMEKGIFKKYGINLQVEHTQESDAVTLVGAGEVPFAVVSGEQVLLARAQDLPVVYTAAWYQQYPVAVAAPLESGIQEPQDLAGKKVGIPVLSGASYIGYRALLSAAGMDEDSIYLDTIGYNQVELLLQGIEDAVVIYAANEPFQLENLGMPVHVIRTADYVQLASNGLITSEQYILEQPELVQAMVQAMLESIQRTMGDAPEAFEICKKYVDGLDESNQDVQRSILLESMTFWESDQPGYSNPEAWENMQTVLLDMQLLAEPVDLQSAFTNEFIP